MQPYLSFLRHYAGSKFNVSHEADFVFNKI